MLFVLDVGNTNTVLGVFARGEKADVAAESGDTPRYERLAAHWRVATRQSSTIDEYGVLFRNLFSMAGLEPSGIQGIVISSVVPPLDPVLRQVCERYFNSKPLLIEPGVKTGMPVHYDNPAEVGADRIVNAVAAFEKYGGPCVIVDFGTATTFDCVSAKGEYMGGVISPGIGISADALFFANSASATRGDPQARSRNWHQHRGQSSVGALLRLSRAGGWNSRTAAQRIGAGNEGDRHWRPRADDRYGIEIHQDSGRFSNPGRFAHYLGTQCGSALRPRFQGRFGSLQNSEERRQ